MSEHLRGHTTSLEWLPAGVFQELDALRAEQQRLRGQLAAELQALDTLSARCRDEDRGHQEGLRQAHRDGRPDAAEDHRTPADERMVARLKIEERLWAGIDVFAEHAKAVIEAFRAHEDAWLAELRARLTPAQAKRREAERLLAEARAEEWTVHRLGQWIQQTTDDGPLGRQPAPGLESPPRQFHPSILEGSLERSWHHELPQAAP